MLINSYIFTGMSPREDTGNFVQWADQRLLYGVRFDKPSHSKQFLSTVNDYIDQVCTFLRARERERKRDESCYERCDERCDERPHSALRQMADVPRSAAPPHALKFCT